MLTAMVAVDNIIAHRLEKDAIWQVNTEMEYHESKNDQKPLPAPVTQPVAQPAPARAAKAGSKNQ